MGKRGGRRGCRLMLVKCLRAEDEAEEDDGAKDGRSWVCCAYYGRIWEFKISRVVETGSSDSVGICGNGRMGGAKDCGDEL